MKELSLTHLPTKDNQPAQVVVAFTLRPGVQPITQTVPFQFTFTKEERDLIQWYLEEYLYAPMSEIRVRLQPAEKLIKSKGEELFNAVFSDSTAIRLYSRIADDLPQSRIVIHAGDPEGISIPWELIRDPLRGEYGELAGQAHAFVRSQPDLPFLSPEPKTGETFNILMVICRPDGPDKDVAFQSVARPLIKLFRPHRERIRLDILRPPTFAQLARTLQDKPDFYHVVHFDGHGEFPQHAEHVHGTTNAQNGKQGLLVFEKADGRRDPISGERLGQLFEGKSTPIVLLNACQSGMTHPESLYPSLGNQLLKAGVPGVVAMSYSVYVQTAVKFMERLYERLIQGDDLSRAVAVARVSLRSDPMRTSLRSEVPLQDWIVPIVLESCIVQATARPASSLRLKLNALDNQQDTAGTEIGCPQPPDYGFIGRDGVILDLERAFQMWDIVLLEGMAGIGKTETTVGFARWLAATNALDGPIFFFPFQYHLPLSQVCNRIGEAYQTEIKDKFGLEWSLLDANQRRKIVLQILHQRPCLMIWDNFEPVAGFPTGTPSQWTPEEQAELKNFLVALRGGATKTLITSRRDEAWLGNIYRHLDLPGLKLRESQDLARRVLLRIMSAGELENIGDYNDLLIYLCGNPLAIQTILPELKRTKPDVLLQSLKQGELSLPRNDDAQQGRDRSLYASLSYCLTALDPELYRQLSVLWLFQGFVNDGILADLCQTVANSPLFMGLTSPAVWKQRLNSVAELGWVRTVGDGCYTVHPALPWFFHDLAHEVFSDQLSQWEQAFVSIYAEYGSWLFDVFNTNTQFAIDLLQWEENNLLHALRLARHHELWRSAPKILYGLSTLWTTQGRWTEWERLVQEWYNIASTSSEAPVRGREFLWNALMGHKHEIAYFRRDFTTQEHINLRLKSYFEQIDDKDNLAGALHHLGIISQARHELDKAEQWYRQSLALSESIGNKHGQMVTLNQLGVLTIDLKRLDDAEQYFLRSLSISAVDDNKFGQALALHNLGIIAWERREFDKAQLHCEQSLNIARQINDKSGQASTLRLLGTIAQGKHELNAAEKHSRESLIIEEDLGNEHGQADALQQLGMIAEERGRLQEALDFLRHAEVLFARLNDPNALAKTQRSIQRIQDAQVAG